MEQQITRNELNATIDEALRLQTEHLLTAVSDLFRERDAKIVDQLTENMRTIETNLLTSFHGYARSQTARMHALETTHHDVNVRLAAIEDRLLNLEARRNN